MKKKLFVAAMLGMTLVLGMMLAGCANGSPTEEGYEIFGCVYTKKALADIASYDVGTEVKETHYLLALGYEEALEKLTSIGLQSGLPAGIESWGPTNRKSVMTFIPNAVILVVISNSEWEATAHLIRLIEQKNIVVVEDQIDAGTFRGRSWVPDERFWD